MTFYERVVLHRVVRVNPSVHRPRTLNLSTDARFPGSARYPDSALLTLKTSPEDEAEAAAVLFTADTANAVIDTMVNSFDNVRRQALEVLLRFPAPLPGITDRAAVARLLAWGQDMIASPRARESDSGALVIKVVHLKYVKELSWFISPCPSGTDSPEEAPLEGESPSLYFVRQLLVGIDRIIAAAHVKFESTFGSSFAQGALLALRQVLPDLDIPALLGGTSSAADEVTLPPTSYPLPPTPYPLPPDP